jgi:hypothetical protein
MMKRVKVVAAAVAIMSATCGSAFATPTGQIAIPSTDAKGFKEVTVNISNIARFTNTGGAANPNYYNVGVVAGVLPFEAVKLEIGADFITTGNKGNRADDSPFYFNAKLATAEDLGGHKWIPAFAVGVYNMGTFDKPEIGLSTRQNIVYGLVAKTLPIVGRISAGGYHGSSRALATNGNPSGTDNNSGALISWDRTMTEISDKLWFGIDYMSGNNANGELGFGASWAFSKQITLLTGVQIFNPGYKASQGEYLPGGKPAFTTQLFINF